MAGEDVEVDVDVAVVGIVLGVVKSKGDEIV